MRIYNEVILNWNDETEQFDTVYEDAFNYSGPMMRMADECMCKQVWGSEEGENPFLEWAIDWS